MKAGESESGIRSYLQIKGHLQSQTCYGLYYVEGGSAQMKHKRSAHLTMMLLPLIIVLGGTPPEV